jgi:hypothetical protein
MEVYQLLLEIIKQAIQDDDLTTLKINLMRLPFEKLNQKTLDHLLSQFINHSVEYNNTESIKVIFEVWYQMLSIDNGQLDHLTRLFMDSSVNDQAKLLVAKTYMDEKPIDYYISYLIDYDSLPETVIAAKILDDIFDTTYHTWFYLFDIAVENEIHKGYTNYLIKDYIKTRMIEKSKFIKPPTWIINDYNKLPSHENLINDLSLKIPHYPIDDIVNDLSLTNKQYNHLSIEEQEKILNKYDKQRYRLDLNFKDDLIKILGPVNTQMNTDLTDDTICTIYGGCRMLTCQEFEEQYINEEEVDDFDADYNKNSYEKSEWFHHQCDWCTNKIKYKHYAVRKPIYNGGWIGCYCSWQCVRDSLNHDDVIGFDLVSIFEEQINTFGIQDRIY